ncbi:DUF4139 domain-containing protein [bacterium]|nr:DUF4139 domain-containing protein [bacterium]MCP5461612.1 DUF4139 domain-containing protein [bacterium]
MISCFGFRQFYRVVFGVGIAIVFASSGCAEKETTPVSSDVQTGVSLTVYNSNLALVKDTRSVDIQPDVSCIQFMDVASQIIPTSVHVKSLTEPSALTVLEQNYEFDLMSPQKLMDKYVGKEVKLIFKSEIDGREEERTAILLSNNQSPVYKIDNEIHLGFPGRVILPKIPDNLLAQPTLVWMVKNSGSENHAVEVSYLTGGVSWKCDYVLVISLDEKMMDLTSWISIDNRSGTTYNEANVQLVAGDVMRVQPPMVNDERMYMMEAAAAPRQKQFSEETFFEYHLYTLDRQSTIKDNQIKQITLFETTGVPLKKVYKMFGQRYYYTSSYGNSSNEVPVEVVIEFSNTKENSLGIPLPKGVIRTYKADSRGCIQFTGENTINHTPKDETVSLKIGDAFDIKAERKQLDYRKIRADLHQVQWEITVKNHKDEDITLIAEESLPGDWKIIETSAEYEKVEANIIHFSIPVKANGEAQVVYTVQIKY